MIEDAGSQHARHTGPDDRDVEVGWRVQRREGYHRADPGLLADQSPVVGRYFGPDGQVHRRLQDFVIRGGRNSLAGEVRREHFPGLLLDLCPIAQIRDGIGVLSQMGDNRGQGPAIGVGEDCIEVGHGIGHGIGHDGHRQYFD